MDGIVVGAVNVDEDGRELPPGCRLVGVFEGRVEGVFAYEAPLCIDWALNGCESVASSIVEVS